MAHYKCLVTYAIFTSDMRLKFVNHVEDVNFIVLKTLCIFKIPLYDV